MRLVYLLLHDFRFASLSLQEFAFHRFHFAKEYARRMARLGHDVKLYVLAADVPGRTVLNVDGYELKAFRVSFRLPPFGKFGNDHSLEVLRELGSDAPDVVHFHNYYLWNFPYVAAWARMKGARVVGQYHGSDPLRGVKAAGFTPSLRLCDLLLVPLESEKRMLTGGLRIPEARVARFPSTGVDTDLFRPTGPKTDELSLLYAGRIPAPSSYLLERSPQHLIPIMKALLDSGLKPKLTVAGDGPGMPAMRDLAQRLGVAGSIDFLGQVDQTHLPELFTRSTLSFVPIRLDEVGPFWGGSLQESLACGTPVAAFNDNAPGRRKLGLLLPTNPGAAASLISDAVADREWMASVRDEGPRLIKDICEWRKIVPRLDSVYSTLAGRKS